MTELTEGAFRRAPNKGRSSKPAKKPNGSGEHPIDYGWYSRAMTGTRGNVLSNLANCLLALREDPEWRGRLIYDETQQQGLLDGKPLGDNDTAQIREWLQLAGLPSVSKDNVYDAINLVCHENRINPLRDHLEALEWDQKDRISDWLHKYMGADDTEYTRAVGRMWLIGAVARVYQPGCQMDYMMVLEGDQGVWKSTACRIIGGQWFSEDLPQDLSTKDAQHHLRGKWIVEVGELAAFNKAEVTSLKTFLSKRIEMYRPAYGRHEVHEPRQCAFVGTTNKSNYLRDETGGRRFWPIKTSKIELEKLKADRDQLLAQAVDRYKNDEHWWPDREFEAEHFQHEQEARFDVDVWEDSIATFLAGREVEMAEAVARNNPNERALQGVTVGEVATSALSFETAHIKRADQNRIMATMEKLGWQRGSKPVKSPDPQHEKKSIVRRAWFKNPAWTESA